MIITFMPKLINRCGCELIKDYKGDLIIKFCPKHAAAPEMYEIVLGVIALHKQAGNKDIPTAMLIIGGDNLYKKAKAAIELAGDSDG